MKQGIKKRSDGGGMSGDFQRSLNNLKNPKAAHRPPKINMIMALSGGLPFSA